MEGLQCWKHVDDVEVEADFLRAEGDISRHIHLPLCDVSFLKAGCRELRNPTQRAGHIPLSGLVFAHSRHNRVFDAHGETVGTKSRYCRVRSVRCVRCFLGTSYRDYGVIKPWSTHIPPFGKILKK